MNPPTPDQIVARVNQVYRNHLDTMFGCEYYGERHRETLRYAKHFDFIIALGGFLSGGSGLGILADPAFAWLCGLITTLSMLFAIAKDTYDWSGKLRESMELVNAYSTLSQSYKLLVEDINYRKIWNDDFEARFQKLREEGNRIRQYSYRHWSDEKLRNLQNRIKQREEYTQWWSFQS